MGDRVVGGVDVGDAADVDDSAAMLLSVRVSLEMAGFSVVTVSDGVQALATLAICTKPDLIITDINMPNMDGMELIEQVHAPPGFRFTRILTLTTESHGTGRDEAKKLGATGWIVRPVRGTDLIKYSPFTNQRRASLDSAAR